VSILGDVRILIERYQVAFEIPNVRQMSAIECSPLSAVPRRRLTKERSRERPSGQSLIVTAIAEDRRVALRVDRYLIGRTALFQMPAHEN
jgi:hypothetical protein